MRGVEVHAGVDLIGCAVRGYRGGGCITGDHVKIIGCDLRGNGYPIDVPPGIQTQGDIIIKETRIDGASYASIGVAQDSKLAGATISDCPAAQGPYLILRYPVAGVETYTTDDEVAANPGSVKINEWLTGVTISGLASEYLGDGAVVDGVTADEGVGVGPGISGIKWFKNSGDFGMFNTDREWKYGGSPSPYPSKIASWYIKGGIGDFEIGDGFPSGNTTQPAFQALAIHNVTANRSGGAGSLAAIKDGNLLFKTAGTVGQSILGCRLGLSGGNGSPVITAYMLATGTSSVVRGELLMRFQDAGAQKMTDTNQHCIGVVQRAASPSNIVMAVTEGTDSELMVKNSSTLECVNGGLVKPHSGGGVQPATSMLDGPPIGRVYSAAIAAGAIGPCEIFSLT
jgi:hypothetical protein